MHVSDSTLTANSTNCPVDTIRCAGDIIAYYSSDMTLKENVIQIPNALEKISQIGGYTFDWNKKYLDKFGGEDNYIRKQDVGVMAQEIEKVLPEVVAKRNDNTLGVKYDKIVPLLIESIKELKTELDELKSSNI